MVNMVVNMRVINMILVLSSTQFLQSIYTIYTIHALKCPLHSPALVLRSSNLKAQHLFRDYSIAIHLYKRHYPGTFGILQNIPSDLTMCHLANVICSPSIDALSGKDVNETAKSKKTYKIYWIMSGAASRLHRS